MAKAPTPATVELTPLAEIPVEEAPAPVEGGVTVITTGSFMLHDLTTGLYIEAETPTEVVNSAFIQGQLELGQLKLVD